MHLDFRPLGQALEDLESSPAVADASLQRELDKLASGAGVELAEAFAADRAKLQRLRGFRRGFERRLASRWRPALTLFDLIQWTSTNFGSDLATSHAQDVSQLPDPKFQALVRLHGRACLTASEVGALLRTGHATGAMSRWRTMRELAIIAFFLGQGNDDLAERYLLHREVAVLNSARRLFDYRDRFPDDAPTEGELASIESSVADLVKRFGPQFKRTYGWAAAEFGGKSPTIQLIAETVNMGHWAPYYDLANHGVHSGAHGAYFDLGLPAGMNMVPAGPSQFGLSDPGSNALISLNQVSVALLAHGIQCQAGGRPTRKIVQAAVIISRMRALQALLDRALQAFGTCHEASLMVRPRPTGGKLRIWPPTSLGDAYRQLED